MTATQQFIEDAIVGGWNYPEDPHCAMSLKFLKLGVRLYNSELGESTGFFVAYAETLLDPLAWQAVGKTRGWEYKLNGDTELVIDNPDPIERAEIAEEWKIKPDWHVYWHRFIDHLADGISIEEALAAIN